MAERPRYLVRARNALAHDPMRRLTTQIVPVEHDRASIIAIVSADDVDQRGFARPVWTEQREDLAIADFKTDTAERLHAGERLADIVNDQQRCADIGAWLNLHHVDNGGHVARRGR